MFEFCRNDVVQMSEKARALELIDNRNLKVSNKVCHHII